MTETTTAVDQTEMTTRNIDLGFDFAQRIIENPGILQGIPNGVTLILIPDDNPKLAEANIQLGITALHSGKDVHFRHVRAEELPVDKH